MLSEEARTFPLNFTSEMREKLRWTDSHREKNPHNQTKQKKKLKKPILDTTQIWDELTALLIIQGKVQHQPCTMNI